MKRKLLILLVAVAGVAGCGGPASQSGVWQHDTLYRNLDHLRFSWGGHDEVTREEVKKSAEQGWWGKEVEVTVVPVK